MRTLGPARTTLPGTGMPSDPLLAIAEKQLLLPIDETRSDTWLWEHTQRVRALAIAVAACPELRGEGIDRAALSAAALFHDVGLAIQFRQSGTDHGQVLARPTSDIQRELGAAALQEEAAGLLSAKTLRLACDAIRACNDRRTELPEAQALGDAETLEQFGVLYVLRLFRQHQSEGRPVDQLIASWNRQREYGFWELRLAEGLRFESSRRLARKRLASAGALIATLEIELGGLDAAEALEAPVELAES